jgi:hypothetical protein
VLAGAAAVVLVVAAALTVVVVLLEHRDSPLSRPAPAGPADRDTGPATPSQTPSVSVSPATTDDLSWATVAGARVPVSRSAGPRDTAAGRARGFAQTPVGAVLAAAHISLRLSPQAGPAVFEATLREQVVGVDAAALGQHLAEDYEQARAQLGLPYGAPAGQLYSTARGYLIEQDSPTTATVRLLIEGPGKSRSVLIALTLHTQWVGADWALIAPPGGTWNTSAAVVTDSGGYTRFPDGG